MLLGEPERTQGDLTFSLFGIPVRIHPFFWLVALLLGANSRSAIDLLTWIVALFLSILVHELGHAAAMRAYGFRPWIILYGLGGLTAYSPAMAYRSRGAGPLGQILISLAGPGAGFVLAAVISGAIVAAGHGIRVLVGFPFGVLVGPADIVGSPQFTEFVRQVLFISVTWGIINLLPIYPLDGGQIAREVFMLANPRDGIRQSLILSAAAAATVAVIGLVQWHDYFVAFFFGYLAYMSYATLQAYRF